MDKITLLYVLVGILAFLLLLVSMGLGGQAQMIKDLKGDLNNLQCNFHDLRGEIDDLQLDLDNANEGLSSRIDSLNIQASLITAALGVLGEATFKNSDKLDIQAELEKLCR